MWVDILLGAGIGGFLYLFVQGHNVVPILLLAMVGFFVWKFVIERQFVLASGKGVKVGTTGIGFDDIGGQNSAKKELQEALDFLLQSDKMNALGIRPLKGILLVGPPGTGKTLLAKAAACYTNSAFLAVSGSEFVEMYAGVGAERVRSLFRRARELARREKKSSAIIFIDEVDILGGKRGTNISHHEYDQTLNQLLVEMDGLNPNQDVKILVIAATNRPDALDEALLRPGRFDRQVRVDLPDKEGRVAILKIHTANKPLADDVDLELIAQETFGFSGAHLESVANEAAVFALREGCEKITLRHMREAIEKVLLGEQLDRKPTEEEKRRIAVHESGHAMVAEIQQPNSVSQVSVRSRGNALGYVRHYPKDDFYLYTQSMLEEQIKVALAGAVAEEVVLGNRSTGAAGDYRHALHMVDRMIASGMTPLGVVDLDRLPQQTLQEIAQQILHDLEEETRKIIEERKDVLIKLADILQREETLSGESLRSFLAPAS